MLAKQLHDFLHIYRKDTEQICVEEIGQLENERKKYKNRVFNEIALKNVLYKCTEAELEEIMSGYMKNFQDSSVFLGSAKSTAAKHSSNASNQNGKKSSLSTPKPAASANENSAKKSSIDSSKKSNDDDLDSNSTQADNKQQLQQSKQQASTANRTKSAHSKSKHSNKNYLSVNDLNKTNRKTSGDELSGLSCDSRSLFSNSSESDNESVSGSKSDVRSETQSPVLNLASNSNHRLPSNTTATDVPPASNAAGQAIANFSNTAPLPSNALAANPLNNTDPYKIHLPQRKATVTNLYRSYNRSSANRSSNANSDSKSPAFKANNSNVTTTTPINLNLNNSARRKAGINELALNNNNFSKGWNNDFSSTSSNNNSYSSKNGGGGGNKTAAFGEQYINDETVIRNVYLNSNQHHTVRSAKSGKYRGDHGAVQKLRAMTAHGHSSHHRHGKSFVAILTDILQARCEL